MISCAMKEDNRNRQGEYEKSYGGSSYNKDERSHYSSRKEDAKPSEAPRSVEPPTPPTQGKKRMKTIYKKLLFTWLFLFILSNVFAWIMNDDSSDEDVQTEETIDDPWEIDEAEYEEEPQPVPENVDTKDVSDLPSSESSAIAPTDDVETVSEDGLPSLEELERINHAEVVKEAKRAGVSTEGTTLEIMERINHAEVVKEAKRAGVSKDGTTLEIMERIARKEMEKRE